MEYETQSIYQSNAYVDGRLKSFVLDFFKGFLFENSRNTRRGQIRKVWISFDGYYRFVN